MRTFGFYVLIFLPLAMWCLVVLPNMADSMSFVSEGFVSTILKISPILGGDFSIFGEVTPFLLAVAIIALMPPAKEDIKYIAVVVMAITYLLYLYLSLYFSSGVGEGLLAAVSSNVSQSQSKILGIVSNVRTMTIVMTASILGYKFKSATDG